MKSQPFGAPVALCPSPQRLARSQNPASHRLLKMANLEGAIESMSAQLGQVAGVLAQLQSQMGQMNAENAALRVELAETRNIALAAQAANTSTGLTTPERQTMYAQMQGAQAGASVQATTHPDVVAALANISQAMALMPAALESVKTSGAERSPAS